MVSKKSPSKKTTEFTEEEKREARKKLIMILGDCTVDSKYYQIISNMIISSCKGL
jgi:hypothetical protein